MKIKEYLSFTYHRLINEENRLFSSIYYSSARAKRRYYQRRDRARRMLSSLVDTDMTDTGIPSEEKSCRSFGNSDIKLYQVGDSLFYVITNEKPRQVKPGEYYLSEAKNINQQDTIRQAGNVDIYSIIDVSLEFQIAYKMDIKAIKDGDIDIIITTKELQTMDNLEEERLISSAEGIPSEG